MVLALISNVIFYLTSSIFNYSRSTDHLGASEFDTPK
jgi:hypothetical protein